MTQATYYAKYSLFSTYTSIQFGLMIGIIADYGPILYYPGRGATNIWFYNKSQVFSSTTWGDARSLL